MNKNIIFMKISYLSFIIISDFFLKKDNGVVFPLNFRSSLASKVTDCIPPFKMQTCLIPLEIKYFAT